MAEFQPTKQQPLAVSHWLLAKQRKAINTIKARGEMLKQVQHDSMHNVILNLVQDLSADKNKKRLAENMTIQGAKS